MSFSKSSCFEAKSKQLESIAQKLKCSCRKQNAIQSKSPVSRIVSHASHADHAFQSPITNIYADTDMNDMMISPASIKKTALVYGFDTTNATKNNNIPANHSTLESSPSLNYSSKVTSKLKVELMTYQKLRNDEVLDRLLPKIYKVKWNSQ